MTDGGRPLASSSSSLLDLVAVVVSMTLNSGVTSASSDLK
jgi:hypothetical protein